MTLGYRCNYTRQSSSGDEEHLCRARAVTRSEQALCMGHAAVQWIIDSYNLPRKGRQVWGYGLEVFATYFALTATRQIWQWVSLNKVPELYYSVYPDLALPISIVGALGLGSLGACLLLEKALAGWSWLALAPIFAIVYSVSGLLQVYVDAVSAVPGKGRQGLESALYGLFFAAVGLSVFFIWVRFWAEFLGLSRLLLAIKLCFWLASVLFPASMVALAIASGGGKTNPLVMLSALGSLFLALKNLKRVARAVRRFRL